jgi:Mrp family chromosome partitioning ATPase
MTSPPNLQSEAAEAPALADYGRVLLRRKWIVLGAALVGLLLGLAVLPAVQSGHSSYEATQRVDVKPLSSDLDPGASTGNATRARDRRSVVSGFVDVTVMEAALADLGELSPPLTAEAEAEGGSVAQAAVDRLSATPVEDSSAVDFSYRDDNRANAVAVVRAYSDAYASARNERADALYDTAEGALSQQAAELREEVRTLSQRADAERAAGGPVSTLTQTELSLATGRYEAKVEEIDRLVNDRSLRGTLTSTVGSPTSKDVSADVSTGLLVAIGLVLAAAIGVGVAFLVDSLRPTLHSAGDVEQALGLPVLATISGRGAPRGRWLAAPAGSPARTNYQFARGVLQVAGLGSAIRTLAVMGPDATTGRSAFVVNVAASLAAQGDDVIIVSADIERYAIERFFDLEGRAGLTEVLSGVESDPHRLLVPVAANLMVLPAGAAASRSSDTLIYSRLGATLRTLSESATVIIDAPGTESSADAIALAHEADAAVIVLDAAGSRRSTAERVVTTLRRTGVHTLGIVLTSAPSGRFRTRRTRSKPAPSAPSAATVTIPAAEHAHADGFSAVSSETT